MPLQQDIKQDAINTFQVHETDTGSADVQVAILTRRIEQLTRHLQQNPKDFSSRRGLMTMIGQRKSLLNYIADHNPDRFRNLVDTLGIRVRR